MSSCSKSRICYTESKTTWDRYKNKGKNKCYILLRDGWEDVEEEHTEPMYDFLPYDGYDEYGLSMIFVFVNPNNDIATCNTRWNHSAEYGSMGVDNALGKVELSKILGVSFNSLFRGYTEEDGIVIATFETAQGLLDKGYKPEVVFDDAEGFSNGFIKVKLKGKCNYINKKNKILSNQWFDRIGNFKDGFGIVQLNSKFNFINLEGKLISEQWFDWAFDFANGFGAVKLNNQWNLINTDGKVISDQWYDRIGNFKDGFVNVELNGEWNFTNAEGDLLSDQWFDVVYNFDDGFAPVKLNDKWNFIDTEGKLLSDQWFNYVWGFNNGVALVRLNREIYKINKNGKFIE